MAVYFVTGKLGAGKSVAAVGRIRDYLREGRKVATNVDIWPDKMLARDSRATLTRLPDKPRVADLEALGAGCDGYDEARFGLIVLDECGTWLNARNWNDKERAGFIDWFLHARKHRWDVIFLIQDIEAVDKQLRGALCEHLVVCRRLDRLAVPYFSTLVRLFTLGMVRLRLPKVHLGTVFYGDSQAGFKVERWLYKGSDLYDAYDTMQVFRPGEELLSGELVDMRASYSVLSAWHVKGRYSPAPSPLRVFADMGLYALKVVAAGCVVVWATTTGRSPVVVARQWRLLRRNPVTKKGVGCDIPENPTVASAETS